MLHLPLLPHDGERSWDDYSGVAAAGAVGIVLEAARNVNIAAIFLSGRGGKGRNVFLAMDFSGIINSALFTHTFNRFRDFSPGADQPY
jgi:hypothetical protein